MTAILFGLAIALACYIAFVVGIGVGYVVWKIVCDDRRY